MTAEPEAPVPDAPPTAPEPPARWSERFPARAALTYALVYLLVAGAGGELGRLHRYPLLLLFAITVTALAATLLSLLFVLSLCRTPLRLGAGAALFVLATAVFLATRPEVTLALAQWLHLPRWVLLRIVTLPSFPGDTLLGNLALISWASLIGRAVGSAIREGNLLLPAAVVASLADIVTVFWGFVGHASRVAPQVVAGLSAQAPAAEVVQAHHLNVPILTYIGIGDFLFIAIFLTVALRFRLRAAAAMWAAFLSMLIAAPLVNLSPYGLPGVPFISAGVLWVNRRCFHFSQEEKRALAVAGALIAALLALGAVLLLRR